MSDHLSLADLSAIADGELSPEQLTAAGEHLAGCPSCTASALSQTLLKSAISRAGIRYPLPAQMSKQILARTSQEAARQESERASTGPALAPWSGQLGWAVAATLLLVAGTTLVLERSAQHIQIASTILSAEAGALVTEVSDQHIATLASGSAPQVESTDRHTVKPWFQGKLPFSFNLPEGLPADTKLDGADLTYVRKQPVAQLLYSIGKHRVSVFVTPRRGAVPAGGMVAENAGFHVRTLDTDDLELIAVSDVDPARLSGLLNAIGQTQTRSLQDSPPGTTK